MLMWIQIVQVIMLHVLYVFFAKLLLLAGYLCARQQSAWTNPCKLEKLETLVDFATNLSTFSRKLTHRQAALVARVKRIQLQVLRGDFKVPSQGALSTKLAPQNRFVS